MAVIHGAAKAQRYGLLSLHIHAVTYAGACIFTSPMKATFKCRQMQALALGAVDC
jgi:hypothetical protein